MKKMEFTGGVKLQPGVFSRSYSPREGKSVSVAYHTPSQSITFLEDDSAEVWKRLYESGGETAPALDYILKNGTFEGDPQSEAKEVLLSFVEQLRASHLLNSPGTPSIALVETSQAECSVKTAVSQTENMELEVSQFMADHRMLYSLVVELTYRCNERCVHCYLPEETRLKELSLGQIDSLLGEFASLGGFMILLTGGEPFIREDFIEILSLVKKYGLVTSINSNLTLLNDRILEAIASIHPRSVGVSIYAGRADLHDAITTNKGSFEKSVNAIRRLRKAGVPVIIKSPLMKSTAPHWREIEALANDLGCDYQFDLSITAKNDGKLSPLAQRVTDNAVLEDIFASRYYRLYVNDEPMSAMVGPSPETGLCGAGASGLCISPDGVIRPCIGLTTPIGRWPENSLDEVWRTSPFFSEFGAIRMNEITPCNNCSDFKYCSRCPGAWHAEHGDYRKPSSYSCTLAHAWATVQQR